MCNIFDQIHNEETRKILEYFQMISEIPRESGNEKKIGDYLVQFAKDRGYEAKQDNYLNVIIKKAASRGYENLQSVILQGHLDMVCAKTESVIHDFKTDPIKIRREGDLLFGDNTSLGADNGIAIAYMMAILDNPEMPHPALEMILTSGEESTMNGAMNLDCSDLKGELLINLDSEEEEYLCVSSAGGRAICQRLKIEWQRNATAYLSYAIKVKGLKGGHSGDEIIEQRGNANLILGRILFDFSVQNIEFEIVSVSGGTHDNAIPRESEAILLINENQLRIAEERIDAWNKIIKDEFAFSDPQGFVEMKHVDDAGKCSYHFSTETKEKLLSLLMLQTDGVVSMEKSAGNLVRSSINLGIVKTTDSEVLLKSLARSSMKSELDFIINRIALLSKLTGCEMKVDSDFPAWPFRQDSKLRELCRRVYKELYSKELTMLTVHSGLECGWLLSKMPYLDAVSYGPDMFDVHTPFENISISSIERVWIFLSAVLKELNQEKKEA